jgi:hypothetical protein
VPIELQVAHLLGRDFTSRQALCGPRNFNKIKRSGSMFVRNGQVHSSKFWMGRSPACKRQYVLCIKCALSNLHSARIAMRCGRKPPRLFIVCLLCLVLTAPIQTSGLAGVIAEISKLWVIMKACLHTRELFRKNRLHDSLACILTDWTPKKVVERWPHDLPPLYKTQVHSVFFHPLLLVDVFSHTEYA